MDYNVTYRDKNKGIQAIVSYKDQYGKWKQKSKQGFARKKDAKSWADEMVQELKETVGYAPDKEFEGITLEMFAELYKRHLLLYREYNTNKTFNSIYNKLGNLYDKRLDKITVIDLQNVVDDMTEKGVKYRTIRTYLAALSPMFNTAMNDYKIIKENPLKNIKLQKPKEGTKDKIKALNEEEYQQVLALFKDKPKHSLLVQLILKTGLRIGEAVGITWDCIDFKDRKITINKQWKILKNGKAGSGFGKLKTTNSYRTIPVSDDIIVLLKDYKKNNPVINIDNRIFHYTTTDGARKTINRILKANNFDFTIHDFRHTYVTRLISKGMDFKSIATLIGDTVEMVMEIYSHFNTDMEDRARNIINSAF